MIRYQTAIYTLRSSAPMKCMKSRAPIIVKITQRIMQ